MPRNIRSLKFTFSFSSAVLIAATCMSTVAVAQTEPGSLDDLLGADFEPLQGQVNPELPDLNSPLILGPPEQRQWQPQTEVIPEPQSVLTVPRVGTDEPAPDALVLPDLTMPTPDNTAFESRDNRRSLKPQSTVQPPDPIELLPFNDDQSTELRTQPRTPQTQQGLLTPRMQSPQALNYGNRAYSSRSRIQVVPVQIEFFSVSRGIGYPYGGYGAAYRSGYRGGIGGYGRPPVGYSPYGGYVPYGGYGRGYSGGRNCPSRR